MSPVLIVSLACLWLVSCVLGLMVINLYRVVDPMIRRRETFDDQTHGVAVGTVFPVSALVSFEGPEVPIVNRDGYGSLLIIATTTCKACHSLFPELSTFHKLNPGISLTVALKGSRPEIAQIIEANALSFPVAVVNVAALETMHNRIVPFAYFLDSTGRVLAKGVVNDRNSVQALASRAKYSKATA